MKAAAVIVFGAGGHGKVVADAACESGARVIAFIDDAQVRVGTQTLGIEVRASSWLLEQSFAFGVALGIGDNAARERLVERCRERGLPLATIIHPSAVVSKYAEIGDGSYVAPGAVVNAGARIGVGAIINTSAIVDHDAVVGAFAHVSPGACLAGGAALGLRSQLGAGATILDDIAVGDDVVVGGGALVNRSVPDGVVAYGVPARVMRKRKERL